MRKRLVFVQRGKTEDTKALEDALKGHGWDLETIHLSKDEPLPKSFENIDGLLITGSDLNVYDQSVSPLAIY
jgi:GMP synthase-like glutamine amidotransferase